MKKSHELVQQITARYSWDDINLTDEKQKQLMEVVNQLKPPTRTFTWFGLTRSIRDKNRLLLVFHTITGTDKTIAAQLLANEIRAELYRVDLAMVVSKYIGETERNLDTIFDRAESMGWVLFFDEADALFGKRTEIMNTEDCYYAPHTRNLHRKIEEYRGLVILSAGRRELIDRLFKNRIRYFI